MSEHNKQPIIQFEGVSKRFSLDPAQSRRTVVESLIELVTRQKRPFQEQFWAVKDVSFDVMAGQSVGIIGRNGSGKSTILKLISRILRPTSGRVVVRGRVSALLELGAGFHPDLTGRENIFLNSAVLGLNKAEVEKNFDSIVAFSELAEFIDMPVKHYSSGMYMRLGFSVAIHVQPHILIIDEILAVGDQAFQAKCLKQIYDMKKQGTTIIMVSHDMKTMQDLCSHLVWIEHGQLKMAGAANEVAGAYLEAAYGQIGKQLMMQNGRIAFERWGNGDIEITGVRFLNHAGVESRTFKTRESMTIEMDYLAHHPIEEPEFGLAIYHQDGTYISGPNNRVAGLRVGTVQGAGTVRYHIRHLPMLPATYRVTAAIHNYPPTIAFDYHKEAYTFQVVAGGTQESSGVIELPGFWECEGGFSERYSVLSEQ